MIRVVLRAAAAAARAHRAADDESAAAPETMRHAAYRGRVFHPPGVIRLVTPIEEAALAARTADSGAPPAPDHPDSHARRSGHGSGRWPRVEESR